MRALRLLVLTLLCSTLAAAAAHGKPARSCGSGHWFELEPPAGWVKQKLFDDKTGPSLSYASPGASPRTGAQLTVQLRHRVEGAPDDLDQLLLEQLRAVIQFGSPSEIRDTDLRHPTLPSRSARVTTAAGQVRTILVDPGDSRRRFFVLTLASGGGPPSKEHLGALRAALDSLRFDPNAYCVRDEDDRLVVKHRSAGAGTEAAAAEPSGEIDPSARLSIALFGCEVVKEARVPVSCVPARLAGEDVRLVRFEDGQEPAASYAHRNLQQIGVPWCWKMADQKTAPPLVFWDEGKQQGREYSCETRKLDRVLKGSLEIAEAP